MTAQTIEYQVSGKLWRVNQGKQFSDFFRLKDGQVGKLHFWGEGRTDLLAAWTVARMFFGIEPVIQDEKADIDLYGSSLSIDEIAEKRGCDAEEVKMELQAIGAAWKVFQRTIPVEAPAPVAAVINDFTPPAEQTSLQLTDAPLTAVQTDVLKFRGFSPKDFEMDDKRRTDEQSNQELQALYGRIVELKKVFDEPMAKEVGRQALINEIFLRRIDQQLLRLATDSPKFAVLRETKQEVETTLLKQWAEVEKICPFIKGAINKMTAIGAFSDLARGYQEWTKDKTKQIIDGMFTAYEIQAEMWESEQLPPHYRPGWVAAIVEARAGLFDPNFRRSISNSKCKILDMAFQAAAKAYNERFNVKLPDLLRDGEQGEYPDIILADSSEQDDEPQEERGKENIDDQLAAEAAPPIELDKTEEAFNGNMQPVGRN